MRLTIVREAMQFSPIQSLFNRGYFLRDVTQNREKLNDSTADELIFSYARLVIWLSAPCVVFVYGLLSFLPPEFRVLAQNSVLYTLVPGTIISIWVSYRGEMKHLLYGMILFQFSTALSWCISATCSSMTNVGSNYYLILPVIAPVIVGTIIIFCIYPVQMMVSNFVFFTVIIGFPLLVDANAQEQFPAFVSFCGAVLVMGIFVFCISNITTVLYGSIAEKEEQQLALAQVQTVINDGLDAAPFGLLCYKDDGTMLIECGVSAYFPDRRDIKTQDALYQFLLDRCDIDLDAVVTDSVQAKISDLPVMISRKQVGSITVISFVDMTERQQWEERALAAEKMGLIGQITSGITHDYNNSLAVAISCIERVPREKHKQVWDEHLELAFNALDEARDISKKLLTLSGVRNLKFDVLDVDNTILAMAPMLYSVVPDIIDIRVRSDVGEKIVTDSSELEAALLNLVINAKSAIGPGNRGLIRVDTAVVDGELVISVTDDGHGIPADIMGQIYDPFFTTHEGRNSPGMGLTTVKSFMGRSNGGIQAISNPGNTVFELRFPLDHSIAPALSEEVLPTVKEDENARVEKILLVDDNVPLLEVMAELVELQNVECSIAGTVHEARSIMKESEDFDAVFIDLSMPEMNGIDLGTEFLRDYPKCRYYLLTGERLTEKTEHAIDHGFRGVFFKPLRVAELLEAAAT